MTFFFFPCCIGVCVYSGSEKPKEPPPAYKWKEAVVSEVAWRVTEEKLVLQLVHESGSHPPSDALNVKCERKQSGTEHCNSRECVKNWCEYDLKEWKPAESRQFLGTTIDVLYSPPAQNANEHVNVKTDFTVTFMHGGETWQFRPRSEEEFKQYTPGSRWELRFDRNGALAEVRAP